MKSCDILNETRSFSNLDPDKLIHDCDRTTYHLIHRKFILVKHLSDLDDHLMEHKILPIDEEYPFLLPTKEELDVFKESKTKKEFASAALIQENFRKHALRKIIKSSLNSTHVDFDSLSSNIENSFPVNLRKLVFFSRIKAFCIFNLWKQS